MSGVVIFFISIRTLGLFRHRFITTSTVTEVCRPTLPVPFQRGLRAESDTLLPALAQNHAASRVSQAYGRRRRLFGPPSQPGPRQPLTLHQEGPRVGIMETYAPLRKTENGDPREKIYHGLSLHPDKGPWAYERTACRFSSCERQKTVSQAHTRVPLECCFTTSATVGLLDDHRNCFSPGTRQPGT